MDLTGLLLLFGLLVIGGGIYLAILSSAKIAKKPQLPPVEEAPKDKLTGEAAFKDEAFREESFRDEKFRNEELSVKDFRDEQFKDKEFRDKKLKNEEFRNEVVRNQVVRNEVVRNKVVRDEEFRDEVFAGEEFRNQEFRDEVFINEKLKGEVFKNETFKNEAFKDAFKDAFRDALKREDTFETAEDLISLFPPEVKEEYVPEPPREYHEDRITTMARDPVTIYAYWEFTHEKKASLRDSLGSRWDNSVPVVRIHDVTGVDYFNGHNSNEYMDVIINEYADNWYFNVCRPDRAYCAELGRKLEDGTFLTIVRSNLTYTPRNTLSDKTDPQWMLVTDDQKKLYDRIGKTGEFSSYHLFQPKQ